VRIERGLAELARQTGVGPLFIVSANPDAAWVKALRQLRFGWEAMENSWNQWVLSYSAQRQMSMLDRLGFEPNWRVLGVMLSLAVAIVAIVLAVISLRHRVKRDPLAEIEGRFRRRLQRAGMDCAPTEGPRAIGSRLRAELAPASLAQADAILHDLERWRYSPASRSVPAAAIRRLRVRVRRFRVRLAA
jgi:hypothetical protein